MLGVGSLPSLSQIFNFFHVKFFFVHLIKYSCYSNFVTSSYLRSSSRLFLHIGGLEKGFASAHAQCSVQQLAICEYFRLYTIPFSESLIRMGKDLQRQDVLGMHVAERSMRGTRVKFGLSGCQSIQYAC